MRMSELEDKMDQETVGSPKKKTPAEMNQSPLDMLEPETSQTLEEQNDKLDDAVQVPNGDPEHGHDWSINDNDSKNGPVR